jgi:hypothetical protein
MDWLSTIGGFSQTKKQRKSRTDFLNGISTYDSLRKTVLMLILYRRSMKWWHITSLHNTHWHYLNRVVNFGIPQLHPVNRIWVRQKPVLSSWRREKKIRDPARKRTPVVHTITSNCDHVTLALVTYSPRPLWRQPSIQWNSLIDGNEDDHSSASSKHGENAWSYFRIRRHSAVAHKQMYLYLIIHIWRTSWLIQVAYSCHDTEISELKRGPGKADSECIQNFDGQISWKTALRKKEKEMVRWHSDGP